MSKYLQRGIYEGVCRMKETRYRITFSYKGKRQNVFKDDRTYKEELEAEAMAAYFSSEGADNIRVEEIKVTKGRNKNGNYA